MLMKQCFLAVETVGEGLWMKHLRLQNLNKKK
jgi:hypothetical protein